MFYQLLSQILHATIELTVGKVSFRNVALVCDNNGKKIGFVKQPDRKKGKGVEREIEDIS
jgi:hypothetical protein